MICIVTVVLAGMDCAYAASQGLSIYGYYLETINQALESYTEALSNFGAAASLTAEDLASVQEQLASAEALAPTLAGCWFALYFVQASLDVFVALVLCWIFIKILKLGSNWAPFSEVDLPVSLVWLLIAGLFLYAASCIPGFGLAQLVRLVAFNVLAVCAVPLSVQGLAAGKGLMNKIRLGTVAQAIIALLLVLFGILPFVSVILGLVDFWANLRNLPREAVSH